MFLNVFFLDVLLKKRETKKTSFVFENSGESDLLGSKNLKSNCQRFA